MKPIVKSALINALLMAAYVVAIASFLFYVPKFFDAGKPDTVLVPITMLLLFVLSAAITGTLMFGQPVLWYLEGKKKESISLFTYTLAIFFIIVIIALFMLFLNSR